MEVCNFSTKSVFEVLKQVANAYCMLNSVSCNTKIELGFVLVVSQMLWAFAHLFRLCWFFSDVFPISVGKNWDVVWLCKVCDLPVGRQNWRQHTEKQQNVITVLSSLNFSIAGQPKLFMALFINSFHFGWWQCLKLVSFSINLTAYDWQLSPTTTQTLSAPDLD